MPMTEILQNRVDLINPPPNVGRLPRKVESGFPTFTVDQWKHWILIDSLYALRGVYQKEILNVGYSSLMLANCFVK